MRLFDRYFFWRIILVVIAIGKITLWAGSIGFWAYAYTRGMEPDLVVICLAATIGILLVGGSIGRRTVR